MNNRLLKLTSIVFFAMMAFLTSCTEDLVEDPDTDPRAKFIGSWNVKEEIQSSVQNYSAQIINDPTNNSRILIGNIFNLGEPIPSVVSENSISLVNSNISGFDIKGQGIYSGGGFVLNYTTNDGSGARQVKATYVKK